MLLKDILKELNLTNSKTYYRNGHYTIYTLTYDYKPFLENWNLIYDKLGKRKIIDKIENYKNPHKFICDLNRIMFSAVPKISSKSCSFRYINKNYDMVENILSNIFKNIVNNGFLDSFEKPYIFLKEINNWEKESWYFGIEINKNNLDKIILLKEKLSKLFEDKQFSICLEIKDLKDISLNGCSNSYMNRYNIIDKKINFDLLLKLNKEKLSDKLYKGGLKR